MLLRSCADMPPKTPPKVDPAVYAAIESIIQKELQPIKERLGKIEDDIAKLAGLPQRMDTVEGNMAKLDIAKLADAPDRLDDVEKGVQDASDRLDDIFTRVVPTINAHIARVSEALAEQTLRIDVHRRKWNVIVRGLDGAAGEDEVTTRRAVTRFARDALKIDNPENVRLAACHRVSNKANAGVIVRFSDLSDRDRWLAGTKHLKGLNKKMSVSPDLPPVIRPLKDELMKTRSEMDPDTKSKSRVRYIPKWPFVELKTDGRNPVRPNSTLSQITETVLDLNPLLIINAV